MDYAANITEYWQRVTTADLDAGAAAYPAYLAMLQRIAGAYGTGLVPTVEAFVALSPNNDYFGNLRSLVSVVVGVQTRTPYTISTYKACGIRAESYLRGDVSFVDTVKGKKIIAFRDNILYQKRSQAFVLDGHMIAIAVGARLTMSEANRVLRDHKYDTISGVYARFARKIGMPAHELQATLWHCRKRTEAIKFSTQRDMWRDDHHLYYAVEEILPYPHKEALGCN